MSAQEWLDRADAMVRAVTEGPWSIWRDLDRQGFYTVGDEAGALTPERPSTEECNPTAHVYTEADAEFIAASRTLVPAMSAALRAVLVLHVVEWDKDDSGDWGVCRECGEYLVQDPICLTVRAITDTLEGGQS